MITTTLSIFRSKKIIGGLFIFLSLALIGCPPPAPQTITIQKPADLQAHDIDPGSGLASIPIKVNLTSSSGQAPQVGTFEAFVTLDIPGVGPDDVDDQGNLIEQPVDITSHFTVNYFFRIATLTTPLELPMGWYFLQAKVLDVQNVEASDLVIFSVDYPGPTFIGSTESPYDLMPATLSGIYDECFNGALNEIWSDTDTLGINNVPTFLEIKAAPLGLPVHVEVPTIVDPSGILTFTALVVNNAILFPPVVMPPIDLSPWTNGLVPCELNFSISGVFRRTGPESMAPRLVLQDVSVANSPSGGTCWLPQPPTGCEGVVDLEAEASHPPVN